METLWQEAHRQLVSRRFGWPHDNHLRIESSKAALTSFLSKSHKLHSTLFPPKSLEAWKYTSLKGLEEFSPHIGSEPIDHASLKRCVDRLTSPEKIGPYWSADRSRKIVTVNGIYRRDLSDPLPETLQLKETPCVPWKEQIQVSDTNATNDTWGPALCAVHHAFTPVNLELSLTRSAHKSEDTTERLVWVNLRFDSTDATLGAGRMSVTVQPGLSLEMLQIDEQTTSTSPQRQATTKLFLQEINYEISANTSVRIMHLQNACPVEHVLTQIKATQSRDSRFHYLSCSMSAGLIRNMIGASLEEEGAHAEICSYYNPSDDGHIDNQLRLRHRKGYTTSRQHFKGIVADKGAAVFHGTICIDQGADKSEAHQLNRNVILGSNAQVYSQPELAIDADDVACSHGSSIGPLSEEEIFYLQSRALSRDQALTLMRDGYIRELADAHGWARETAIPFTQWSCNQADVPELGNIE